MLKKDAHIREEFNKEHIEGSIDFFNRFFEVSDAEKRLAFLHNDLRSLPSAKVSEWLLYHSYDALYHSYDDNDRHKQDDLAINLTTLGLINLKNFLGNLDTSLKGSAVTVYMAAEFLYVLTESGNTSPVLPKIAEAVGSLSEQGYQNPEKLRDTLCHTLKEHLELLEDIRAGKKFPPNPFAKHGQEQRQMRHYNKVKASQK